MSLYVLYPPLRIASVLLYDMSSASFTPRKGWENQPLPLESEVEDTGELSRALWEDLTSSFGIATVALCPGETRFIFPHLFPHLPLGHKVTYLYAPLEILKWAAWGLGVADYFDFSSLDRRFSGAGGTRALTL